MLELAPMSTAPAGFGLQFVGGKVYEYTAGSVGPTNLKTMKRLADDGEGLTTFINTHPEVKDGYI